MRGRYAGLTFPYLSFLLVLCWLIVSSQEHCTDQVTGFLISKLIVVLLITFFGNFATFFGNNFLLSQGFLIRKLLLDEVILLSC